MGLPLGDQALSLSGEHMLTDCTHCGATFRVTPAQLGASGGRVRCGLCSQVFDGFVRLRSEPETAPPASAATAAPEGEGVANTAVAMAPDATTAIAAALPADSAPEALPGHHSGDPPGASMFAQAGATGDTPAEAAGRASPPQGTAPVDEHAAHPEDLPTAADDEVELAFDAADAGELDGTLADIEIPTDLPAVEAEDDVGADALDAVRSAVAPIPEPGSEERAMLDDTLTDIEIPTELLELTVVDEDDMPRASSPAGPAAAVAEPPGSDGDATWVSAPEPAPEGSQAGETGGLQGASPGERLQSVQAVEPDRPSPASPAAPALAPAEPRGDLPSDTEIIPGFPGFVPEGMSVPAAAGPAVAALPTPSSASKRGAGRAILGLATALLALLLPVQGMVLFRDALADRFPAMHPLLDGLCRQAGCRVPFPRRPDKLEIETSDLQALDPARPNRVVLIASIRNLASVTQAYPQLELTLTDPADQPVARRVFEPTHYLPESVAPDGGFAPRGEVSVRLQLDTGTVTPSGYRLFLFHR